MFHSVLNLGFNELIITNCVGFLCLEFLNFSFLALEVYINFLRLFLEPLDLGLQASYVVIITELAGCLDSFISQVNKLLLDFGHVTLIRRFEVFFMVLKHSLKLSVDLIHKLIQRCSNLSQLLKLISISLDFLVFKVCEEHWLFVSEVHG